MRAPRSAYDDATAAEYAGSYNPTWGAFAAISHPTVGNHEYQSTGAAGRSDGRLRHDRPAPRWVLLLTLHPTSYDWRIVPTTAGGFTDAGTQTCH